jgi:hypothetical protein
MFERTSNEALIIEAIRRNRRRVIPKSNPPVYEGAHLVAVLSRVNPWFTSEDLKTILRDMLKQSMIVITGYTVRVDTNHKFSKRQEGIINFIQSETPLSNYQRFTDDQKETNSKEGPYVILHRKHIYVWSDEVPKKVKEMLNKGPIDPFA